ncbi:MAG: RodZ domain-containing protein [Sphingomicrobium sp.]
MDEELVKADVPRVGERLRDAREASGISIEDVAAQTRIPQRHLESLEASDWEKLPAPTYTVGFAKNYAAAVGLDRSEIGEQLREEMGGQRFTATTPEVFEPADPARTMPRWLVLGAIVAVILLVVGMSALNRRSLQQQDDQPANTPIASAPAPAGPVATPATPAAAAQGPVVLTAVAPAWIQVTDQGHVLFSGELAPGQAYSVPATATAPLLKAGKPEALRVGVGTAVAPQVGPSGKVAANVSLKSADLMRGPAAVPGTTAAKAAGPVPAAPQQVPNSNIAAQ